MHCHEGFCFEVILIYCECLLFLLPQQQEITFWYSPFISWLSLPPMGHKKLIRFKELETFPNVLQYPTGMSGNWKAFFKNNNPIILELACGKGEYATGLGEMYPDKNFIGVDLKGNRIWVGAKKAIQNKLANVAFLRTQIDKIAEYFAKDEIAAIWITFPDPQLRMSKAKKRLTHPKFLRLYQQFLCAAYAWRFAWPCMA